MGQSTGPQLRRRKGDYGSDASFAERSFIDNRAGSNAVLRRPAADSNASARMPARPRVQALPSQWGVISMCRLRREFYRKRSLIERGITNTCASRLVRANCFRAPIQLLALFR